MAQGEPPFAVEAWATRVCRDLAAMADEDAKHWRALFGWWDASPPPYAPSRAARVALQARITELDGAPRTARGWLASFVESCDDTHDDDNRIWRNVFALEGLLSLAALDDVASWRDLFLAIVRVSFLPLRRGAARRPRLGYRAADALAAARVIEPLHSIAADIAYPRARRYLASL